MIKKQSRSEVRVKKHRFVIVFLAQPRDLV